MTSRQPLTLPDVRAIHDLPLTELLFRAQGVHRQHHKPDSVQLCQLLSIKTGGCPEDCGYCSQSARHEKTMEAQPLMDEADVLAAARQAKAAGATRFCMGAAWRNAKGGEQFERVLRMVRGVRELGMEACVTAGMLSEQQAQALKSAGLTAYNHNLDTSREFYGSVVTTRTYEDRLRTLDVVRRAGIHVCCGGIIGMGETRDVRYGLLRQLAILDPHPESVPLETLADQSIALADLTPRAGRVGILPDHDAPDRVQLAFFSRVVSPALSQSLHASFRNFAVEAAHAVEIVRSDTAFGDHE